jgi:hypothetical protein
MALRSSPIRLIRLLPRSPSAVPLVPVSRLLSAVCPVMKGINIDGREPGYAVDRLACLLQYPGRKRRKAAASDRRIEVKPIAGALGAEIANVDLSTLDDTVQANRGRLARASCGLFRNQTLTPEQQIAFAKRGVSQGRQGSGARRASAVLSVELNGFCFPLLYAQTR